MPKHRCPWPTQGQAMHWTCHTKTKRKRYAPAVNLLPKQPQ